MKRFTQEDSLEDFMTWWTEGRYLRPPFKSPIHVTDIAYALCLYRDGPFQVELYVCKPNTESPMHTHDGVESISIYLSGNLQFSRDGKNYADLSKYQYAKPDGTHALFGQRAEANFGGAHALRIGKEGGSFLIFEKWHGKDPVSVTVNWQGETVGSLHDKTIAEHV